MTDSPADSPLGSASESGSDVVSEPVLRDAAGVPETVYLPGLVGSHATDDGWVVSSLDVGSWRPLAVGDRVVALDRESPAEFLVEVVDVEDTVGEVFYRLLYMAELDAAAEPGLDSARAWLGLE